MSGQVSIKQRAALKSKKAYLTHYPFKRFTDIFLISPHSHLYFPDPYAENRPMVTSFFSFFNPLIILEMFLFYLKVVFPAGGAMSQQTPAASMVCFFFPKHARTAFCHRLTSLPDERQLLTFFIFFFYSFRSSAHGEHAQVIHHVHRFLRHMM